MNQGPPVRCRALLSGQQPGMWRCRACLSLPPLPLPLAGAAFFLLLAALLGEAFRLQTAAIQEAHAAGMRRASGGGTAGPAAASSQQPPTAAVVSASHRVCIQAAWRPACALTCASGPASIAPHPLPRPTFLRPPFLVSSLADSGAEGGTTRTGRAWRGMRSGALGRAQIAEASKHVFMPPGESFTQTRPPSLQHGDSREWEQAERRAWPVRCWPTTSRHKPAGCSACPPPLGNLHQTLCSPLALLVLTLPQLRPTPAAGPER